MFAIFMLLVIFAFLAYQTMPNFILQRTLYESRERPSKIYSWSAFMLSNIIVEIPWNSLAAVLIFLPFYYIIGMDKNAEETHTVTERSGLMFLLIWAFMMHCGTFTTMMVASVPNAEVGAILALLLFCMSLYLFAGTFNSGPGKKLTPTIKSSLTINIDSVIATPVSLPGFWIFMYRVSPLTYLISSMLSAGLAKTKVTCSDIEITLIRPPSGKTCAQYLSSYMQIAGGAVYNPDTTANCQFCALTNSDTFLTSVSSYYDDRWRNLGLMWAYIAFNIVAALFLYWVVRVPKK
jgi:ABC-2 type transporter.